MANSVRARSGTLGNYSPIIEVEDEENSSDDEVAIVIVANDAFNRVGIPQGRLFCIGSCVVITGTVITGVALWITNLLASYNRGC